MTKFLCIAIICTAIIYFTGCAATKGGSYKQVTYVQLGKVLTAHGEYMQRIGGCRVKLESASMGGYSVLSLGTKEINDVTGFAWASPDILVYTVSPIYGKPGIYTFNCITKETRRIVTPMNINAAYPNGADYFELYQLSATKIFFYYTPDVDSVNFKEFRTQPFLFQTNLDGSEMKKAVISE